MISGEVVGEVAVAVRGRSRVLVRWCERRARRSDGMGRWPHGVQSRADLVRRTREERLIRENGFYI